MKKAKPWIAAAVLLLILIRPTASVAGARRAMYIWCTSVAPALFPFLALMPLLTGPEACASYNYIFGKWMHRLFRLPGSAAAALVIGLLSGSPGGAIAVRRVAETASLSQDEVRRLGCCICGVSPAFLILGVGQGMYGSAKLGFALAGVQMIVQLGMLAAFRRKNSGGALVVQSTASLSSGTPIGGAVENILCICGYMVLFSSVATVVADLCGEAVGLAVLLLADQPTGLANLAGMQFPGKMLVLGAAIGFGGLCIGMQNLDVLRPLGLKTGEYFAAKATAASFTAAISGILFGQNAGVMLDFPGFAVNIYVISLFTVGIFALPAMIYFSSQQFLNIGKKEKSGSSLVRNHNI